MKRNGKYAPENIVIRGSASTHRWSILLIAAVLLLGFAGLAVGQDTMNPEVVAAQPSEGQAVYSTPEEAANAFHDAVKNNDRTMLGKVLGPNFREVLPLDDVEAKDVNSFLAAWDAKHGLVPEGDNKRMVAVGEGGWTLPLPIVSGASGWFFDIQEGLERMIIRAIGRNELATMQAVLAYYDAQLEYAEQDRNGDGMLEYAQRLISTPGKQDGLYWEVPPGEPLSPLGPLVGDKAPGGGYHGYHYRILDAQGEHAPGGAHSYLMGDRMRSGFALVAWPSVYGETGVMSFIVSHSGTVYEQNLGPDTAERAEALTSFDPDEGWMPVKELQGS